MVCKLSIRACKDNLKALLYLLLHSEIKDRNNNKIKVVFLPLCKKEPFLINGNNHFFFKQRHLCLSSYILHQLLDFVIETILSSFLLFFTCDSNSIKKLYSKFQQMKVGSIL